MGRTAMKIAALAGASATVLLSLRAGAQARTLAPSSTSMQAGGLTPPAPIPTTATPGQPTSQQLVGQPALQPPTGQPALQPPAGQPAPQPPAGQPALQPPAGQPMTQPGPGVAPSMQVGGLAPPALGTGPAVTAPAPASPTTERLARSDAEDSGRGLDFVFVGVEGGFSYAGLEALHANGSLLANSSGAGAMGGAKAGLRLLYLTAGPRFRVAKFSDFLLWTLNLDFEWRVPLGKLEPFALIGGGYTRVGSLAGRNGAAAIGDVSIDGFDVRIGGGLDYYLSGLISVGALMTLDLTRLQRAAATSVPASAFLPGRDSASAFGLAFGLVIGPALHF